MEVIGDVKRLLKYAVKSEHFVNLIDIYADALLMDRARTVQSLVEGANNIVIPKSVVLDDDQKDIVDLIKGRMFDWEESDYFVYPEEEKRMYDLNRKLGIIEYSMNNPDGLGLGYESRVIGRRLGSGADSNVYETIRPLQGVIPIKVFKYPEDLMAKAILEEGVTLKQRMINTLNVNDILFKNDAQENVMKVSWPIQCSGVVDKKYTGLDGNHTYYLELEDIDGNAIEMNHNVISLYDVNDTYMQIMSGMRDVHNAGLLIRDLKLPNILISSDQRIVKIADLETFAKIGDVKSGIRLTQGSSRYASPESLKGSSFYDIRSDVYSCAACGLYMLTDDSSSIRNINNLNPDGYEKGLENILSGLDEGQRKFLRRGLAFKPEDRYHDASDMILSWERLHRYS